MSRHSECGAIRADIGVAVLATAVVLGVGVFIGASVLGESSGRPPMSIEPARPTSLREAPSPTLQASAPPSDLEKRLAAIERAVDELRTLHAIAMERVRHAAEEFDQLKRAGGMPAVPGGPVAETPVASERASAGYYVPAGAWALGLDAVRRKAMATQLAQTVADLKALQAAHAEASHVGSVITFKIGKYGDGSRAAIQRWQDWIDRNLSPEEKEAYKRDNAELRLLGMRTGLFDRTIRIDLTGDPVQIQETIATEDGPMVVMEETVPDDVRTPVLDDWYGHLGHLVPESEDR